MSYVLTVTQFWLCYPKGLVGRKHHISLPRTRKVDYSNRLHRSLCRAGRNCAARRQVVGHLSRLSLFGEGVGSFAKIFENRIHAKVWPRAKRFIFGGWLYLWILRLHVRMLESALSGWWVEKWSRSSQDSRGCGRRFAANDKNRQMRARHKSYSLNLARCLKGYFVGSTGSWQSHLYDTSIFQIIICFYKVQGLNCRCRFSLLPVHSNLYSTNGILKSHERGVLIHFRNNDRVR